MKQVTLWQKCHGVVVFCSNIMRAGEQSELMRKEKNYDML